MRQWWALHSNALPMDFTKEEKETLQDLTGQMPILLSALTTITIDGGGKFSTFLDKLWESPEVMLAESQISTFIENQSANLQGTPLADRYVYISLCRRM